MLMGLSLLVTLVADRPGYDVDGGLLLQQLQEFVEGGGRCMVVKFEVVNGRHGCGGVEVGRREGGGGRKWFIC